MTMNTGSTSHGGARKGLSKKFADIPASAFLFDSENAEYAASIAIYDHKGLSLSEKEKMQFNADFAGNKRNNPHPQWAQDAIKDMSAAKKAASIGTYQYKVLPVEVDDNKQFALAKNNAPDNPPQPKPVETLPEKQATREDIELLRARLEAAEIKHEAIKAALYDELCAQELEDVLKIIKEMNG